MRANSQAGMLRLPAAFLSLLNRRFAPESAFKPLERLGIAKDPVFLLRQSTVDSLHALRAGHQVVLQGAVGMGKSVSLLQLAATLHLRGSKVAYIPNLRLLTQGYYPYNPRGSVFEQPEAEAELAKLFKSLNTGGNVREVLSDPAVAVIVDDAELLLHRRATEYCNADGTEIPPDAFPLLSAIKARLRGGNNVAMAVNTRHADASLSNALLSRLSLLECSRIVEYYQSLCLIGKDASVEQWRALSDGIPLELLKACLYESVYGIAKLTPSKRRRQ